MKKIGMDFDGVITDTDPVFREYIRKVTGKYFRREMVTGYFYEECLPVTKEDVDKAYELMLADNVWKKMAFLDGAAAALRALAKNYEITVITARPLSAQKQSEEFLKKNKIPFSGLYFVADGDKKINVIGKLPFKFDFFVEDRLDFARDIALSGIKTFMPDYPWNKTEEKIPNLRRVKDWFELRKLLDA